MLYRYKIIGTAPQKIQMLFRCLALWPMIDIWITCDEQQHLTTAAELLPTGQNTALGFVGFPMRSKGMRMPWPA